MSCLLWASCSPPSAQTPSARETTSSDSARAAAPTTPAGVLPRPEPAAPDVPSSAVPVVLGEVDNGFRKVPIPLGTDHGFLVMNAGDEDQASPRIALGRKNRREVVAFKTVADFEAALRRIPAGTLLHRHDRCLRPTSSGLEAAFLEGVEQALARSDVQVAPDTVVTCLCGR